MFLENYKQLKKIDPNVLEMMLSRGKVEDSDMQVVYNFCKMVFAKHYLEYKDLEEDLVAEGVLGFVDLVHSKIYGGGGTAYSFLYSRVKNRMYHFIYKDNKVVDSSRWVTDGVDVGDLVHMYEYVEEVIDSTLELQGRMKEFVLVYFRDKFTSIDEPVEVGTFTVDFVDKYRYYVNYLELRVLNHFFEGGVFTNKLTDILDVLEAEKRIDFNIRMFMESLSENQLLLLLYANSNFTITLPSKHDLLTIDSNLSIYKKVKRGTPMTQVATRFRKGLTSIESVVSNYDIIFS